MSLFTMNDEEAGKPKYLSDADKALTFGVDRAEAANPTNRAKGIKTPGWNKIVSYTDAQGKLRNKVEVLVVAGGDMTGDLDGSGADIGTGGGGGGGGGSLTFPLTLSYLNSSPNYLQNDTGFKFNPTGTVAYQLDSMYVWSFALTTPWDLSTMQSGVPTNLGAFFGQYGSGGVRSGFDFNSDGTKIAFIYNSYGSSLPAELILNTPWDITSAVSVSTTGALSPLPNIRGVTFSADGNIAYSLSGGNVCAYNLSTPYGWAQGAVNSPSASYDLVNNLGLFNYPGSISFSSDGTIGAVFESGSTYSGVVTQFQLAVPFDITTINASTKVSTPLAAGYGYVSQGGVEFVNSDTEIVVTGTAGDMMSRFATAYTI